MIQIINMEYIVIEKDIAYGANHLINCDGWDEEQMDIHDKWLNGEAQILDLTPLMFGRAPEYLTPEGWRDVEMKKGHKMWASIKLIVDETKGYK